MRPLLRCEDTMAERSLAWGASTPKFPADRDLRD